MPEGAGDSVGGRGRWAATAAPSRPSVACEGWGAGRGGRAEEPGPVLRNQLSLINMKPGSPG